ncbi:MAG: hypothetical protein MJE63_19125 [Proteobacteria bacterium]|nr:hypothetical protein [Pseudomonadota bacterium]
MQIAKSDLKKTRYCKNKDETLRQEAAQKEGKKKGIRKQNPKKKPPWGGFFTYRTG